MINRNVIKSGASLAIALAFAGASASAAIIQWADWTSSEALNGFTGYGTITTATTTVDVTYNNPQGIAFFQTGHGGGNTTDYFQSGYYGANGRDPLISPFTSAVVENIPTAAEMIALQNSGLQSLTFSEAIANPVFSYVSLNGNGYAFDQDFEILSFGDPSDGNDRGYWGYGTSTKNVVDLGGGNYEYQLVGTGEPHGTIRFTGAFDTVSWRSLSNENWNGFTVGIEGTKKEILDPPPSGVPDTGSALGLLALSLTLLFAGRRKSIR